MSGQPSMDSPLRILHVTREWPADKKYGLGRSLMPIIEEMEHRGYRVLYLCQEGLGRASLDALRAFNRRAASVLRRLGGTTEWENLCWGITERINMGRLAARVALRDQYTHVHLHDPYLAWGFRLFTRWHPRRIRWGVTIHGFGSYTQAIHEDGARLGTRVMQCLRRLESRVVRQCDWVIFPTEAAMRQMQRDLGIYPVPDGWRVMHHAKSAAPAMNREEARAALGWDPEGVYVLAVGRLVWIKNFPMAVRACAQAGIGGLRLVIVGEGDHEPLKALARELGFADRLQFAVTDDVNPYYRAADVYLSASRSESFGMANLEAMVAGAPIVSTAVGGVPEVLGAAAAWIPSEDEEAVRIALRQVLSDARYRGALVDEALARAEQWPDVGRLSDTYEQLYRQAVV